MHTSMKRTVAPILATERSIGRSLLLAALLVLALASAAPAATLDTPALLDISSSGNFICNFTNLDPAKTATLNPSGTSGLVGDDGALQESFPTSVAVPPGQTATTFRRSCLRNGTLSHASVCYCHFEFTGVSKTKVRAGLSTDVAGSVAAD